MFKKESSNYIFLVIFLFSMIGVSKNAYSEDQGWYGAVEFGEANPSATVNFPKLVTRIIRVFQLFMFNPIFPGRKITQ